MPNSNCLWYCSYLEIHEERVFDLLNEDKATRGKPI